MFWDRFSSACKDQRMSPNSVAENIGVSSATITKWKNGAVPRGEVLKKISEFFNLPSDYFLELGAFSNWEALLERKDQIILSISNMSSRLSSDILKGISNISFAKLVYAFNVEIIEDPPGSTDVTIVSPIPVNSSDTLGPEYDMVLPEERDLLSAYRDLSRDDKRIILGKTLELRKNGFGLPDSDHLKLVN